MKSKKLLRFAGSTSQFITITGALASGIDRFGAGTLLNQIIGSALIVSGFVLLSSIIFSHFRKGEVEKEILAKYHELISEFMEKIVKSLDIPEDFRISLFVIHPKHRKKVHAKVVLLGRVAGFHSQPYTSITFEVGKGCVGKVFESGRSVYEEMPDFKTSPDEYYETSLRNFKLNKQEVDRLSVKARCYLGIPIRGANSMSPVAAVVVDTKETKSIPESLQVQLEEIFAMHSLAIEMILKRLNYELLAID